MSHIRQINEDSQIIEQETPKEIGVPETSINEGLSLDNIAIAQVFDLDLKDMKDYKEGLETLMKWVKTQTDDLEPTNIKWVIRNLEDRLGSPPLTEKRIVQVVRFATLDLQSKKIEREKESLLNK